MSALIAMAVPAPLAVAALLPLPAARRFALAVAPWAALPALAAALWTQGAALDAPQLVLGVRLGLDATGRTFLLFTALLWLVAGASARAYFAGDAQRVRFWACFLLTQAGNVLLVVALDAASFYLGFAVMTFAAYGLVVHAGTDAARHAGRVYLVMAVLGEGALLAGLFLALAGVGNAPLPRTGDGALAPLAAVLLFTGFGVKAGVPLLHMWLPLAHPVAPTPASAVLSGAMIKAGVLGWLRFLPPGAEAWPLFGSTVMALALAAMFGAIAVGAVQRDAKTVLAYSSVSQMGFLTLGVGAGLLAPAAWPALAGAIALYALHHGLAKGALFLGVGAVPAAGRARRWALAAMALPALALAGAPLSSGALSKTTLKAALAALPPPWSDALALLLPVAAAGTTLLLARFLLAIATDATEPKRGLAAPWLAAVVLSLGVAWLVGPAAAVPFDASSTLAAAAPVVVGVALAAVVVWLRRFAPGVREPAVPPGDLLVWVLPPARLLWRLLHAASGWSDRPRPQRMPSRQRPMSVTVMRGENALRRFAVAGVMLLLLLLAVAATGWAQ